jgi:hypothetical protein
LDRIGDIRLFNPKTGNYNLLIGAELLKDQPLYHTVTKSGVSIVSSTSHKVLKNAGDNKGIALIDYTVGGEILKYDHRNHNLFNDEIVSIEKAGTGDIIRISLEEEFIYVSGTDKWKGIVAHNRKIEV